MGRHSGVRNRAEYLLAIPLLKSLEWTPLPLAHRLARMYIGAVDLLIPRLRKVARRNLSLAMPELSEDERERIVAGVFRSLARLLVAFARIPSIRPENLDRWIRAEGYEHFDAAQRAGKGVLFATAHLGNWELSAYAHALLRAPMNVIVRPLDNPAIERLVERRRARSGNRIFWKKDFARGILKALAANQAVGVLIDQNTSLDRSVFVDFFGMQASAATVFARLAAHTGAAVIPGFALWSDTEQRYILRFYPPVVMTGDATVDTQTLQTHLETVIRAYPDQWLWIHRRWKTQPPGAPSVYETAPAHSRTL